MATSTRRTMVGTLGIVGLLAAGIVGFVAWDEARTSKRLSAEAEAIGFVATPTQWYDSGSEKDVKGHALTYAFVDAARQVHSREHAQITWYDAARTYKVCYNPADPSDSKLYPASHVCGS
jgi:hypothetical protein